MVSSWFRPPLLLLAVLSTPWTIWAQTPAPSAEQLKTVTAIRQQRVDLLRQEIKQTDERIESRLDVIIKTLTMLGDSKDSKTRVTRMKEDTAKVLMDTINYYDRKRAALREDLRIPRLGLTAEEKRKMIEVFDARIEKRAKQILALHQSMPARKDYGRKNISNNAEYDQSRRMASHDNLQRDAILEQLDASMARLDRQSRTIKNQLATMADPVKRQALTDELNRTETLITERRKQRLETLQPSGASTRAVALDEAMDLDKTLQSTVDELRRDFNTLFARYNALLAELPPLHASEAALAAKPAQ